ncbi:flagellar basal-body MS-ring/collar protein FliF [Candidatus Liberibacter americanus]|uniref:Flagellar M-ring protein n=1 Tax=Candidatus Liberibacter americanus str. Sao Paulo TaxID=1261131 RepID=U6B4S7_9HYPH|nr:flagellar basal-body MS-ring/collar protein FliF [Candidatus Liberibacter americanus]AHA27628.1 Flagellar biosynthesis/type III secretory pathway lipoprotein [Candidatus Liberibacter americanus str. Sao Paulo]EMS36337.1 flagellar MS-ring protein [Candidatus Liberibacter americanus PW_SP]
MAIIDRLLIFLRGISSLGRTRLIIFITTIVASVVLIFIARFFVGAPIYESIYVKLEASDVNRISMALSASNIDFRISDNGSSVLVPSNLVSKARVLLVSQGLPSSSSNSGYELFDKVNSFGLTSFMQEVTRVRALEGEIARTIQAISGIVSARVHIVMPDMSGFRRIGSKPTAAVMIRAINHSVYKSAAAIRSLVASAVQGLDINDVIVLDSTGKLLVADNDIDKNSFGKSLGIVKAVQNEIEMNINKALGPFLGIDNFRSAVIVELNTDTQQIKETVYDPDSRVERSVRLSKDIKISESIQQDSSVTVEQNMPNYADKSSQSPHSKDNFDKKEEQSNYEINTKSVSTTHNNYKLERLSIAVVVNKARLLSMLGKSVDQQKIDSYLSEINRIVSAATGINAARGDTIRITSMDFLENQLLYSTTAPLHFMDILSSNFSIIVNAIFFLIIMFCVLLFGIYVVRIMNNSNNAMGKIEQENNLGFIAPSNSNYTSEDLLSDDSVELNSNDKEFLSYENNLSKNLNNYINEKTDRRLLHMVEINEERFAKILRKWARSEIDSRYSNPIG